MVGYNVVRNNDVRLAEGLLELSCMGGGAFVLSGYLVGEFEGYVMSSGAI